MLATGHGWPVLMTGALLPIWSMRDSYEQMMRAGYGGEYADQFMSIVSGWMPAALIVLAVIGSVAGAHIGRAALRKRFRRTVSRNGSPGAAKCARNTAIKLDPCTKPFIVVIISSFMMSGKINGNAVYPRMVPAAVPFVLLLAGRRAGAAFLYAGFLTAGGLAAALLAYTTGGPDLRYMREAADVLRGLRETGKAPLVISRDLEFIMENCTYVLPMNQGKIADGYPLDAGGERKLKAALLKPAAACL